MSTGDWSQYDGSPDYHPDGRAEDFKIVVPESVGIANPGFENVFQATTGPDSNTGDSGRRTLTTLWPENPKQHGTAGSEVWARDMLYLPSATWKPTNGDWGVDWVWEWHNWPDSTSGDKQISLGIYTDSSDGRPANSQGKLALVVHGGGSAAYPIETSTRDMTTAYIVGPNPVPRDRWMNFVFHSKWSGGADGFIEWYMDGQLMGRYNGPTLLYYKNRGDGQPGWGKVYWQHGYYTGPDLAFTNRIYHAGAMVGPTAASVGSNAG